MFGCASIAYTEPVPVSLLKESIFFSRQKIAAASGSRAIIICSGLSEDPKPALEITLTTTTTTIIIIILIIIVIIMIIIMIMIIINFKEIASLKRTIFYYSTLQKMELCLL